MLNAIRLLEDLGKDARLRDATRTDLEAALASAELPPSLRSAILARDPRRIEALLGAVGNVCCMVHAPEDDEDLGDERERVEKN